MKPTWKLTAVFAAAAIALAATLVASGLPSQKPALATAEVAQPTLVIMVGCVTNAENGAISLGKANFFESNGNNGSVEGEYDDLTCAEGMAATASRVAERDCKFIASLNQLWKYCVFTPTGDGQAPR